MYANRGNLILTMNNYRVYCYIYDDGNIIYRENKIGASEMKKYEKPVACFDKFVVLKNTAGKTKLKVRQDILLRKIMDEYILIPTGKAAESLQGIMSLNESGYLLWEKLQSGCFEETLVAAVVEEYEVTPKQAEEDVKKFLEKLEKQDLLE